MNKKYAIFDMDGTLIDSMGIWRNLGREYLISKGITENIEDTIEEIAPLTMSESATLFVERFSLHSDAEGVAKEMNGIMDSHYKNDIPLKKGVKEYLESLKESGVRMCVASATAEFLMMACLDRLGVLSYFDFILSCETMSTSKREPDIYLEVAKRFEAQPKEIAVYEDAKYAIETAKNAGFYIIAVYDEEAEKHWKQICELADETMDFN
jgi:HAD superfamily hydrolase (TIGR01509 family)